MSVEEEYAVAGVEPPEATGPLEATETGQPTGASGPTQAGVAGIVVVPARTKDVPAIRALVSPYAEQRVLISKDVVTYYEAVPEFRVAKDVASGEVLGCGALHVMWEDLAEIRTLAVARIARGRGVGGLLVERLLEDARAVGVARVFCLTFETRFFAAHGFEAIEGQAVDPAVYAQLLRSYDEGVAEFLDLERVKPNTLGNARMLRIL